jgi:hypothetical protein
VSNSGLNPSEIPELANADGVEAQADSIRKQGKKIDEIASKVNSEWQKLGGFYKTPDTDTLLNVLKPTLDDGETVMTDAGTVAKALETYASTERTLQKQKDALLTDISSFEGDISGDGDWKKDEGKVKKQQGLLHRIDALIAAHNEAERDCANSINGVYGGTQYRETKTDGSSPKSGEEFYGYSKETLDSASSAGDTPWGKPAEWDKPWYRDAWDGIKSFSSGLWESAKGTVTGIAALVNPFDWKTFSSTWKGVGTLAVDVAVVSSPAMAAIAPDRYKESGNRLKNVGAAMLNVEEWKKNPAKAAGMLTGDVLQTVATGGAGAGTKALSVAGKAGKAAGKAGKVASKLGVSEAAATKATNFATKAANSTAFKADDVTHALRNARYQATDAVMNRAVPQYYKAKQAISSYSSTLRQHIDTAGAYTRAAADRFSPNNYAPAGIAADGTAAVGHGGAPIRSFDELVQHHRSNVGDHGKSPGTPGGAAGEGKPVTLRPRKSSHWGDLKQSEFTKKVDILEEHRKSGPMSFHEVKKGDRKISRAKTMQDFSELVRTADDPAKAMDTMNVPREVQESITKKLDAMEPHEKLVNSNYERVMREELSGFDLDHKVDLQVGGKDTGKNMQWLEKSVNRSVGAQLRNQCAQGQFVKGKHEDGATLISGFHIGPAK